MGIVEAEKRLEKNKRAWLKIFEAAIAVMLMIGFFSLLTMKNVSTPDISEEIYDLNRAVLKDLSQNDFVRQAVLDGDAGTVYNFVKIRLSSSLRFAVRICEPNEDCDFPVAGAESSGSEKYYPVNLEEPESNIYSGDYLVSSSLDVADSTLVKLFIWLSDAPADTAYDEQICGDGDYDEEVEEECEITSSNIIFFDEAGQLISPLTCEDKVPNSVLGNLACNEPECHVDDSACDECNLKSIAFVLGYPQETAGKIKFMTTGQSGTYYIETYNPGKELIDSEEFTTTGLWTTTIQYPQESSSLIVIRFNDKCQDYYLVP